MRTNYSADQVRALIENYAEVSAKRDTNPNGLYSLVRIADVDRVLERLPLKYWEVVLLHGLLGIPQREVANLLQVSQQAVSKRYRHALDEIHYLINGAYA